MQYVVNLHIKLQMKKCMNLVCCFYFRSNIFLHFRTSKQDHQMELAWLPEYLVTEQCNDVKMIVYCR